MGRRGHHSVYVVELSKEVLREAKFVRCNPGYVHGKPCVYVGMSDLDPDIRFDKHDKTLISSNYCATCTKCVLNAKAWCAPPDIEKCTLSKLVRKLLDSLYAQ
jgi:hypothetical protein